MEWGRQLGQLEKRADVRGSHSLTQSTDRSSEILLSLLADVVSQGFLGICDTVSPVLVPVPLRSLAFFCRMPLPPGSLP